MDLKLYLEILKRMNKAGVSNFSAVMNRYLRLGLNKELELTTPYNVDLSENKKLVGAID